MDAVKQKKETVKIDVVCKFLAGAGHEPLTPMHIGRLVTAGMPKAGRGEYELSKCAHWYLGHLRNAAGRKEVEAPDGSMTGVARERQRLLRAQADNEEIETAKSRRQLMAVADMEKIVSDMIMEVKARIMAVAPRVAPLVIGDQSRIMAQAVIERELKAALMQLSKTTPAMYFPDTPPEEPIPAAAEPTRKRAAKK